MRGTLERLQRGNVRSVGPSSNTGQKGQVKPGPGVQAPVLDFCTMIFSTPAAKKVFRCMNAAEILDYVFLSPAGIAVGPLVEKTWNFRYARSCTLVGAEGGVCGKVGFSDDGEVCISLTGQGCAHLRPECWRHAYELASELGARISRVDIAVDDLDGSTFDVAGFVDAYERGEFDMDGRPPNARVVGDMGSGKGCSFYVGSKGHKQLNVYEKGKQLGDVDSSYTRCEVRLYAHRMDLPLEVLIDPGRFFAGAYPMLAYLVVREAERLHARDPKAQPTARAMVNFLKNQAGQSLGLIVRALGEEKALQLLQATVFREGRPGRFRGVVGDLEAKVGAELAEMLKQPEEIAKCA